MNDPKCSRMPAVNSHHVFWRPAIPSNPSSAAPNNQAAAVTGTADTEPPEKPLKALTTALLLSSLLALIGPAQAEIWQRLYRTDSHYEYEHDLRHYFG